MIVIQYDNKFSAVISSTGENLLHCDGHKMRTNVQVVESDDIATEGLTYSKVRNGLSLSYQCDGGTFEGDLLVIPSMVWLGKVTHIKDGAFYNRGMVSAVVPDGVTSIGKNAFNSCDNLKTVVLSNTLNLIGDHAFRVCRSLTSVEIPDSVTSIGSQAFAFCSNLTNVVIGNGVTTIDNSAFEGCPITQATIPASAIASIGKGLQAVVITFGGIDDRAYAWADSLTSVVIGDSVTSIGEEAFYGCDSLTSVTIGNGVTTIDNSAFEGCHSLTNMVIGDSVTTIGGFAFHSCISLTSITFNGTVAQWNAIEKGSYWNGNVPATKVICTDGEVAL